MIPYPHPLTTAVDPAEHHPLGNWNHPALTALWMLAGSSPLDLTVNCAQELQALKLEIPSSLEAAEKTLILVKQGLEASLLKADRDGVHIDNVLDSVDVDDIQATIETFLSPVTDGPPQSSAPTPVGLLDHIGGRELASTPIETVRAYPMTALVKALTTPRAADLASRLRHALGWMSNDGSQVASGLMDVKLLVAAVRIHMDPQGNLDRFDLQSSAFVGQSYDYIRGEFQTHLLRNLRVHSRQGAIVANLALLEHFPSDFAVLDIPADLPYRSSTRWVQFRHGVELAEAIQPGAARTMSYRELADYPLQVGLAASAEQQQVIGMALIPAVMSWARVDPVLSPTLPDAPSGEDIQRMLKAYIDQDAALQVALENVSAPPPKRFDIAHRLLQERGIKPDQLYVNRPMPAAGGTVDIKDYPISHGVPALEVIASCGWEPTSEQVVKDPNAVPLIDTPPIPEHLRPPPRPLPPPPPHILDDPTQWHPYPVHGHATEYFYPWTGTFIAPSALDVFNREFGPWLRKMREGYYLIIKRLLGELPFDDQTALMDGDVRVYLLHEVLNPQAKFTTVELSAPARFGFVIQTRHNNQPRTFEVLPNTLQIIKRTDLPILDRRYFPLGKVMKDWFDFQAHATGRSPTLNPQGHVELALQFGFLQPGLKHPVDERIDQGEIARQQRLEHIARKASASLIYGSDEEVTAYAKGQTRYELIIPPVNVLEFLKSWVIPFWGSVEDVKEGLNRGDVLQVFLGLLGIAFDVLAIIVPGVKAITQISRIALLTTTRALRSSLIQTTKVAGSFLLGTGKDLIPILSLVDLSKLAGRGALGAGRGAARLALIDGAAKAALVSLRGTLKAIPRRAVQLFTPDEDFMEAWRAATSSRLKAQGFQLKSVGPRTNVLVYNDRLGARPLDYLTDPVSGKPYGPALTRLNDAGDLGLRGPATIKLKQEGGGLSFADPHPDLTKVWIRWGDDLYLDMGTVRYKHKVLADNSHVLRRTNTAKIKRADDFAPVVCRPKRGLEADPCQANAFRNTDFVDTQVLTESGRDIMPWFNNRKISADPTGKFIDSEALWRVRDNGKPVRGKKKYLPADALPKIKAQLLGGNDLFKQVTIEGGVFAGVADNRTVSGVVAQYKTSSSKVLVVRADDNLYYRADYTPGDTSLEMQRMDLSPDVANRPITEDDYLALIHNGSGEAHRVIPLLTPQQLADDLRLIAEDLTKRPDLNLDQFIGGPFNMHTSAAEAALFCKYTQTRMISHAKDTASYRFSITAETPLAVRESLAVDLNILYRDSLFDADNICARETLRNSTNTGKNLAYLHVRFNDRARPNRLYYAWSGEKSAVRVPLAELEDALRAGTIEAPQGWKLVPEGLEHNNVIYINAQPDTLPSTSSVLFLPDIQHRSLNQAGKDNTRLLDSERNIVTRIKADELDNGAIASVDAFTVRPTCQSCTIGLDGLKTDMAGVDFNLFEGPA